MKTKLLSSDRNKVASPVAVNRFVSAFLPVSNSVVLRSMFDEQKGFKARFLFSQRGFSDTVNVTNAHVQPSNFILFVSSLNPDPV